MNYSVSSVKLEDGFHAILTYEGEDVAEARGLKNPRAVKRWARSLAQAHKNQNHPAPVETESHTYARSFTL